MPPYRISANPKECQFVNKLMWVTSMCPLTQSGILLTHFWLIFDSLFDSLLTHFDSLWLTLDAILTPSWLTFDSLLTHFWLTFWLTFDSLLTHFWRTIDALLNHNSVLTHFFLWFQVSYIDVSPNLIRDPFDIDSPQHKNNVVPLATSSPKLMDSAFVKVPSSRYVPYFLK